MSDPRTDLPSPNSPNFAQRVRETLMTYLGRQGNILDRGVTFRDLISSGIASLPFNFVNRPGATPPLLPGPALEDKVDLTPPPTPTGFRATGAITHILVEHDEPTFPMGGGYLRTRVYGVQVNQGDPLPTFSAAVELHQFSGVIGAVPSNPATTWRLWVKWESKAGVLSVSPAGGTNGLEVRTGEDVTLLLEALKGEITESQLYNDLAQRINLIDGPAFLPGSVNSRIQQEATTRANADSALSSQITTLQSAVNDNTVAIQQEVATRASETGALFAKYTVKIDNNGYVSGFGLASTANNATPYSEFIVRADRFAIASPSGPGINPAYPFFVRTTPTTINGVNVPVGVYIQDGFIQNGTITNAKIANAAIDSLKVADAAIATAKIADGAITTAKIQDAAITSAKIQDAAITSAKIQDAAITSAKIADASITDAKIVSLSASKISASSLSTITANAGTITAGVLRSADSKFVINLNAKTITIEV